MPLSSRPTVFLVDDSSVIIGRLQALLAAHGCEIVGQAATVETALQGIRLHQPRHVILDLELRDGSGIEVLRGAQREKLAARVIVLTNHSDEAYRRRCLAEGAALFLDKSYDFERLAELLALPEEATAEAEAALA